MKPYNHSLLFLEGTPSWYRQRIAAQRAWDLSEEHVCELWADVGWELGMATDLGLTLDKLLEPLLPLLFREIHNLNLTALLGERNTVSLGQGHTDNHAVLTPEPWKHILAPWFHSFHFRVFSHLPFFHKIKRDCPLSLSSALLTRYTSRWSEAQFYSGTRVYTMTASTFFFLDELIYLPLY